MFQVYNSNIKMNYDLEEIIEKYDLSNIKLAKRSSINKTISGFKKSIKLKHNSVVISNFQRNYYKNQDYDLYNNRVYLQNFIKDIIKIDYYNNRTESIFSYL